MPPNTDPGPRSAHGPRYPDLDRIRWEPLYPPPEEPAPTIRPAVRPSSRPSNLARLVALLLLAIAVGTAAVFYREIYAFFWMVGRLHQRPTEREAFLGFAAFGLVLVGVLAVLRILVSAGGRSR